MRFADKRILLTIAILFVVGMGTCLIPAREYVPHHLSAFAYVVLIVIWGMTLQRRILDDAVSRRLRVVCDFMLLLFFLRICRFSFFPDSDIVNELLWNAYYIPMTAIPLFTYLAALHIEPVKDRRRVGRIENILLFTELLISVVVMSNIAHGQMFKVVAHSVKNYTRNWFYFVVVIWMAVLGLGAVYLMIRKCVLSAARKLWYIPLIFILLGFVLLVWYFVCGGSPKLGGLKLFHVQEAYCLPFISGIESLILIGVIPANSGYEALFDRAGINACIYDLQEMPVLRSGDWVEDAADEDHRIRKETVTGGSVTWLEDLSAIRRLNREVEELAGELEDENELIRQENEIREERIRYETRNRLYNRIAAAVRSRAIRVDELLEGIKGKGEKESRCDLVYATVLCAYIKRMGNLMLLMEGGSVLESGELRLSLAESLDYIALKGCESELREKGACRLPISFALLAYELFETAIEDVWSRMHTCSVLLETSPCFVMTIMLDAGAEAVSSGWKYDELKEAGGKLSVWQEDDTFYIRLKAEGKEGAS